MNPEQRVRLRDLRLLCVAGVLSILLAMSPNSLLVANAGHTLQGGNC